MKFSRKSQPNFAARVKIMNSSNEPCALSRRWSNLRSKVRKDPDLLGKAALILLVTGAAMIAVGLALG